MGLDDDDIAISDYPRVCEELDDALAEIEQLKAALREARWIARTPGPATKAMLIEVRLLIGDIPITSASKDIMRAFLAEWPTPDQPPR